MISGSSKRSHILLKYRYSSKVHVVKVCINFSNHHIWKGWAKLSFWKETNHVKKKSTRKRTNAVKVPVTQIIGILEQNSSTTKNKVLQSNMTEMFNLSQMLGVTPSPELNALANQGWYNQPIVSTLSVLPYQGFALKWVNGTTVTRCYGVVWKYRIPQNIIKRASYCVAWLPGI